MGDSCKDKIYILKELTTFKTDYMNLAIAYTLCPNKKHVTTFSRITLTISVRLQ